MKIYDFIIDMEAIFAYLIIAQFVSITSEEVKGKPMHRKNQIVLQHLIIKAPTPEIAFPIAKREWEQLKEEVSHAVTPNLFWGRIGWMLMGCAGSALLDILAFENKMIGISFVLSWVYLLVCLALGLLFLIFEFILRKKEHSQNFLIVDHMERIENRFISESHSNLNHPTISP